MQLPTYEAVPRQPCWSGQPAPHKPTKLSTYLSVLLKSWRSACTTQTGSPTNISSCTTTAPSSYQHIKLSHYSPTQLLTYQAVTLHPWWPTCTTHTTQLSTCQTVPNCQNCRSLVTYDLDLLINLDSKNVRTGSLGRSIIVNTN